MIDEDGKPTQEGVEKFERGWALIADDTQPRYLQKLETELAVIRQMYIDGDREGLLGQLTRTAPVRYQENDLGLADAQVLNDMATIALCHLNLQLDDQGLIRPLSYQYQAPSEQSSHAVELAHMAALGGAGTPEDQANALALHQARNPQDADVVARQEDALVQVRAALGLPATVA